jgi:hypothetical protein
MIVRIRFGHGRPVTRRKTKNIRAARLTASMLGLVAICVGIFGFWRLGEDLGIAGDFVFSTGFFSHWQVWIAAGAMIQYASWRLNRYSKKTTDETGELTERENMPETAPENIGAEKVTARV